MNNELDLKRRSIKDYIIKLIDLNNLKDAKVLINEYKLKIADDVEICSLLSIIYIMENNANEAELALREGLKIDSTNADLMYNLGYLYECTELKCLPLALGYYRRCFEYTEDNDLKSSMLVKVNEIKSQLTTVSEDNKPLVSIVVLAYNHLDYTKLCVDSIYEYTSHINFELITVDNGSTDGTKAYFESLPNKKNVNIINNVRASDGFNAGIEAAEGKYTACLCNDFIFTKNWLDNLLICIESDESIGYVSPSSNHMTNFQEIQTNYKSNIEMQQFASKYNVSDPSKWEERIVLLPNVLLCRSDFLQSIGGYDPRFYYGEFADNDISFRIRRAGYKLIYAKDTFVHHAGSITTTKEHEENDSITVSRLIFVNKHQMDPHIEAIFDQNILNVVNFKHKEDIKILGINTFCGGTPLQVKNRFRNIGFNSVSIVNITENEKYMEDLKTVSTEVYYLGIDKLDVFTINKKFDIIIYENGFDNIDNFNDTITTLKSALNPGGQLIFTINNIAYYKNLFSPENYANSLFSDDNKICYMDLRKILTIVSSNGFNNIKTIGLQTSSDKDFVENIVMALPKGTQDEFRNRILINKYLISCEA